MNTSQQLLVQAVLDLRRDRYGDLDSEGRALDSALWFALHNSGCDDAVLAHARRLKSETLTLRCAGRVPMIRRMAAA